MPRAKPSPSRDAASEPARGPGRRPAGAIDRRESLLDAALASYAAHGIAATSLRALARDGGVTPAMLNYYFGSREQLVETVVAERLLPVIQALKARLEPALDRPIVELTRTFVTGMHEIVVAHPWLPLLWVREVLAEGGQLRQHFIDRIAPIVARPITQRFARARDQGELGEALEPRLLFVSLMGLTLFPFASQPIWRRVLAAEDLSPERMLEHSLALLLNGIGSRR